MRSEPAEKIDPRALKIWLIHGLIETFILSVLLGIPAVVLIKFFHWQNWATLIVSTVITIILVYGLLVTLILPRLKLKRWRYEVREGEIDLKRGIFWVKQTVIPMARVQHVDTLQGVIMRIYGLASVTISTAAGVHEIPALSVETADELRDRISRLARMNENEL